MGGITKALGGLLAPSRSSAPTPAAPAPAPAVAAPKEATVNPPETITDEERRRRRGEVAGLGGRSRTSLLTEAGARPRSLLT